MIQVPLIMKFCTGIIVYLFLLQFSFAQFWPVWGKGADVSDEGYKNEIPVISADEPKGLALCLPVYIESLAATIGENWKTAVTNINGVKETAYGLIRQKNNFIKEIVQRLMGGINSVLEVKKQVFLSVKEKLRKTSEYITEILNTATEQFMQMVKRTSDEVVQRKEQLKQYVADSQVSFQKLLETKSVMVNDISKGIQNKIENLKGVGEYLSYLKTVKEKIVEISGSDFVEYKLNTFRYSLYGIILNRYEPIVKETFETLNSLAQMMVGKNGEDLKRTFKEGVKMITDFIKNTNQLSKSAIDMLKTHLDEVKRQETIYSNSIGNTITNDF